MKDVFSTLFFVYLFCVFIYTSMPAIYFPLCVEKYPWYFSPQTRIFSYTITSNTYSIGNSINDTFIEKFR